MIEAKFDDLFAMRQGDVLRSLQISEWEMEDFFRLIFEPIINLLMRLLTNDGVHKDAKKVRAG